ncbi:MAG: hypothetical protein OS112_11270 [Methanoregula sp.]|nr:MAG: hypothetical protein OS112_11270 [Methanoregula sp.]
MTEKKAIKIDPRVAKQDAKNAVRDPLDAFIELITNSMDSYNRLKSRGESISKENDGKVELYLLKKTRGPKKIAVIACKDWAEGIASDKLEDYISGYGSRTSGKDICQSIRGFFGRGLKDAAGGLDGIGEIYSVKDGKISIGKIDGQDKNSISYYPVETVETTIENLKKYHLDDGAKTFTMVSFPTTNKPVPNFSTFTERLTKCVPLRPLMAKGNIKLIQIEKGKVIKEQLLRYNFPKGVELLKEENNKIPDENATYSIIICKSEEPLTQSEDGKFRQGGLLIMSGTSVHVATLLKFEGDPNASKFFGAVRCDHIDTLMRLDEHIVAPSRRDLDWDHPFMKKLKLEIENKLRPFIDIEREEKERQSKGTSEEILKKNESMGRKLGQLYKEIIKDEGLSSLEGQDGSDDNGIIIPSLGFGFIPSYYSLEPKKTQQLRLVVESPRRISDNQKISFESTRGSITIDRKQISINEGDHKPEKGIYILRIGVTGNKEGEEGEIIARTKDKRGFDATAKARVVVKKADVFTDALTFSQSEYKIKIEQTSKITLRINTEKIPKTTKKIKLSSNNPFILLDKHELTISHDKGIIESHIPIRGTRVGENGVVIAIVEQFPDLKSEAKIKVVSKNPSAPPTGFKIEFHPEPTPIQRALCKGSEIYIFIKEPTVQKYFGENGEYQKSLSFAVLCADLITDAFCSKVTEEISERIPFLGEDKNTAMRSRLNKYKMKYGPIIHSVYVEAELLQKERTLFEV